MSNFLKVTRNGFHIANMSSRNLLQILCASSSFCNLIEFIPKELMPLSCDNDVKRPVDADEKRSGEDADKTVDGRRFIGDVWSQPCLTRELVCNMKCCKKLRYEI